LRCRRACRRRVRSQAGKVEKQRRYFRAEHASTRPLSPGRREGSPFLGRAIRPADGADRLVRPHRFLHVRRCAGVGVSGRPRDPPAARCPRDLFRISRNSGCRNASVADLERAVDEGSELGCHTFDHLDAWYTSPTEFMASVARNREALGRILPGAQFTSFAYPKSGAKLSVKSALSEVFLCCRGGGQATNETRADLNLLQACFIDRWTGVDLEFVRELVDYNAARRGWLVFVTHDVTADPSPYGCTPEFLAAAAEYARRSGALLLPVGEACARLVSAKAPASTG
jgi:hypothetical protein